MTFLQFMQIPFYRGIDVENAIKLAAADDGYVTYDELRENLRKYEKSLKRGWRTFAHIDFCLLDICLLEIKYP